MDHTRTMNSLEERVRRLLLDIWRRSPTLAARESQLFRDQQRADGRSLGFRRLERAVRVLRSPDAAYAVAAEILHWADETFARPMGLDHYHQEGAR